jgi:hypothetical protein
MKKISVVVFFTLVGYIIPLQAQMSQADAGSKSGTVVSLRRHFMPADFIGGVISDEIPQPQKYVYDVDIQVDCNRYVGRYESSTNHAPSVFDLNRVVGVRMKDGLMILTSSPYGQSVRTVVVANEPARGCPAAE